MLIVEDDAALQFVLRTPVEASGFRAVVAGTAAAGVWPHDGEELKRTPLEHRILKTLARRPGRIVPHATLLKEVWGPERDDSCSLGSASSRRSRTGHATCSPKSAWTTGLNVDPEA